MRGLSGNLTTDVVISGCSAGGQAVYLNLDWWRENIPVSVKVVGVPVDGYILDRNDVYEYIGFSDYIRWLYIQMNSSTNFDCEENMKSNSQNPNSCMFPEYVTQYIKTPFFIMNSKYSYHSLNTVGNRAEEFGIIVANKINRTIYDNPSIRRERGAFVDACAHHCTRHPIIIDELNATYALKLFYDSLDTPDTNDISDTHYYIDNRAFLCLICCGWGPELTTIVVLCSLFGVALMIIIPIIVYKMISI